VGLDVESLCGPPSIHDTPLPCTRRTKPNCLTSFTNSATTILHVYHSVATFPWFIPHIRVLAHTAPRRPSPLAGPFIVAFPSPCDRRRHISFHCNIGIIHRNRTFAVISTCAHRYVAVAPRHRLPDASDQSTISGSHFHWLLSVRGFRKSPSRTPAPPRPVEYTFSPGPRTTRWSLIRVLARLTMARCAFHRPSSCC
jgi:hypothetical protein